MEIIKESKQLPATINELHKFILVGKEQLKAHKAKIRAIEKINLAHDAMKAAVFDAQDVAEIVLDAEAKLGEMIENTPLTKGGRGKTGSVGGTSLSDMNITKKESHYAQKIAKNPDIVEQVKEQAREKGDIPTTSNVIKEIRKKEKKEKIQNNQQNKSETCTIDDLYKLINSGKKFGTIYADPPWAYSNQSTRASTDNHYQTMTVDEIAALPIKQLSQDNAHLHLWTTNAFLPTSFKIIEAWGFEYKSCFIWVKKKMGIGNYWRVSHEFLLLGVKGDCKYFVEKNHKSWAELPLKKHSEKPEEIAHIIEKVSPGPFIELFGRKIRDKWTVWGNEINRAIQLKVVNE